MNKGSFLGVGVNDAAYKVSKTANVNGKRKIIWRCVYYTKWADMMRRCYNPKMLAERPSYLGCTVCDDWLYFSKFKAWMQAQDWEGKQLDKDLLVPGNKVYSPETCIFVSSEVNMFLVDRGASRGEWPIGVYFEKGNNKFKAQCSSIDSDKNRNLGRFDTPEEAHQAWLNCKLDQAYVLAARQTDLRVAAALISMYKNYGEVA
jgi:hypothetical protein